jgi:hypothetical protein
MDDQKRPAVAFEERMRMREIAHHFASMLRHVGAILAQSQRVLNGVRSKSRPRERVGTVGNSDVGRSALTILTRPPAWSS